MADIYSRPVQQAFNGEWTATPLTVVICSSLAGYNALECLVLIISTFKRYAGLYFWSLIVATCGILIYMPGVTLWYFQLTEKWVALIFVNIGWYSMVTGQSTVLYSRLGVVLGHQHENIRIAVKWMIIIDALVFHGITTITSVCSLYAPDRAPFARAYFYIEKIQMTAFSIQELIISGLYIWKTLEILRAGAAVQQHARRIMAQLLVINLIIVFIDVALLTLEYRDLFFHELSFKMLAYAVKAKLEFAILSKLVEVSHSGGADRSSTAGLEFVSQTTSANEKPLEAQRVDVGKPTAEVMEEVRRPSDHRYALSNTQAFSARKTSELDYAEIMKAISK